MDLLVKVVSIFIIMNINSILIVIYGGYLLNKRFYFKMLKNKKIVFLLIIISINSVVLKLIDANIILFFIKQIVGIFLFYYIFRIIYRTNKVYTWITVSYIGLMLFIVNVIVKFYSLYNFNGYGNYYNIIGLCLFFTFFILFKKIQKIIFVKVLISSKKILKFSIALSSLYISAIVIDIMWVFNTSIKNSWLNIITFIFIFIICYSFILLVIHIKNMINDDKINRINRKVNNQIELLDGMNRVKYNNYKLQSLFNDCYKKNEFKQFTNYINSQIGEYRSCEDISNSLKNKISNIPLFGIINTKVNLAKNKGLTLDVDVNLNTDEFDCTINDLCDILGVLLDNAIEESCDSYYKIFKLNIKEERHSYYFKICNTYRCKPNIDKIFDKDFSTKGNNRGLGLWFVKKKVEDIDGLLLNTYFEKNMLVQEFGVKKLK